MLGYAKMFKDKVFAEGKAEGKVEGIAEQYHLALEWNRRRIQAEKEGKEFTEPIPTPEETTNSDKS